MDDPRALHELADAELLSLVAGSAGSRSRDAQGVFYERHVRYLYAATCKRSHLLALVGESPEDLVQETFERAFARAQTFQALPGVDADRARRRARAWLGRIVHHLLLDKLREDPAQPDSPYLDRLGAPALDESAPESPALERVRRALAEMSEREQDVLRVTALYYRAGSDAQRLPNSVSRELAARWQTTNQNIRAIRSRALKRLKQVVAAADPEVVEET